MLKKNLMICLALFAAASLFNLYFVSEFANSLAEGHFSSYAIIVEGTEFVDRGTLSGWRYAESGVTVMLSCLVFSFAAALFFQSETQGGKTGLFVASLPIARRKLQLLNSLSVFGLYTALFLFYGGIMLLPCLGFSDFADSLRLFILIFLLGLCLLSLFTLMQALVFKAVVALGLFVAALLAPLSIAYGWRFVVGKETYWEQLDGLNYFFQTIFDPSNVRFYIEDWHYQSSAAILLISALIAFGLSLRISSSAAASDFSRLFVHKNIYRIAAVSCFICCGSFFCHYAGSKMMASFIFLVSGFLGLALFNKLLAAASGGALALRGRLGWEKPDSTLNRGSVGAALKTAFVHELKQIKWPLILMFILALLLLNSTGQRLNDFYGQNLAEMNKGLSSYFTAALPEMLFIVFIPLPFMVMRQLGASGWGFLFTLPFKKKELLTAKLAAGALSVSSVVLFFAAGLMYLYERNRHWLEAAYLELPKPLDSYGAVLLYLFFLWCFGLFFYLFSFFAGMLITNKAAAAIVSCAAVFYPFLTLELLFQAFDYPPDGVLRPFRDSLLYFTPVYACYPFERESGVFYEYEWLSRYIMPVYDIRAVLLYALFFGILLFGCFRLLQSPRLIYSRDFIIIPLWEKIICFFFACGVMATLALTCSLFWRNPWFIGAGMFAGFFAGLFGGRKILMFTRGRGHYEKDEKI